VDAAKRVLISVRLGDETIRQSAYFRFNNASLPGHIERWVGNEKLIEIDSRVGGPDRIPAGVFRLSAGREDRQSMPGVPSRLADNTPQPEPKAQSNEAITVRCTAGSARMASRTR